MCIQRFIEIHDCLCAYLTLLSLNFALCANLSLLINGVAYVHFQFYWHLFLLMCIQLFIGFLNYFMCKSTIIDTISCLCACWHLLNRPFTYMYIISYWERILPMCILRSIERNPCLCAWPDLLNWRLAYMRNRSYWVQMLPMWNVGFINIDLCLRAFPLLLRGFLAYAYSQSYWNARSLMCRETLIDTFSCLCAST